MGRSWATSATTSRATIATGGHHMGCPTSGCRRRTTTARESTIKHYGTSSCTRRTRRTDTTAT
eukprot:7309967-Heterocapsa_arctica.AAC.1